MDRLASLLLIAAIAAGSACTITDDSLTSYTTDNSCILTLSFVCDDGSSARSSTFASATDIIEDINYYIWDRGRCIAHDYIETLPDDVRHDILTIGKYTIYAIANAGKEIIPPVDRWEHDESAMMEIFIKRNELKNTSFPMSGKCGPLSIFSDRTATIRLSRLVSKIGFRFSPDVILSGQNIKVSSLKLCNAADKAFPFRETSATDSVMETDDFSSETDLMTINCGGTAYFYALENCRGTLLPENDDPWMKTPSTVGDVADLCTYIEVRCNMPGNGVIGGDVTYRFYPGDDNTSNFDLKRNTTYTICLCAAGDGLGKVSWKVEPEVEYTENKLAELRKDYGLHPITSTYVGEKFSCSLSEIQDCVSAYFGGSTTDIKDRSRIRCIADDGGGDLMEFDFKKATATTDEITKIEGTATREGTGSVWLCDADGNRIVPLLDEATVKMPQLLLSYEPTAEYPGGLDCIPQAIINAGCKDIFLYLCDEEGLNLLADIPEQYSFTGKPYRISGNIDSADYIEETAGSPIKAFFKGIHTFDEAEDEIVGQPFMAFQYGVTNTGDDERASDMLTDACFSEAPPFKIKVADNNLSLSTGTGASVYFQDIEYRFIHDEMTMEFSNPSYISLAATAYEFTFGNNYINSETIPDYGKPHSIPASVCSKLDKLSITKYAAIGYFKPNIYATPIRRFVIGKGYSLERTGENGNEIFVVGNRDLAFHGYDSMSMVNSHYSASDDPNSMTGISVDIRAAGRRDAYQIDNIQISSNQDYPQHNEGEFCGTAIFSDGNFITSDIYNFEGHSYCCTNGRDIIYSPDTMSELQNSNAELSTSVIESSSDGDMVTDYLSFTLKNGKATSLSLSLSLYGEVTVYPKGTSKASVLHLIGPDNNPVRAITNSGTTLGSGSYRTVSSLETHYNGHLSGNATVSPFALKNLVTERIFAETETDASSKLNASKTFKHQYHPTNYYMQMSIKCSLIHEIYKGTFSNSGYNKSTSDEERSKGLFSNDCHYRNSKYLWNKKNEAATTWRFTCNKFDCDGIGYLCIIQ